MHGVPGIDPGAVGLQHASGGEEGGVGAAAAAEFATTPITNCTTAAPSKKKRQTKKASEDAWKTGHHTATIRGRKLTSKISLTTGRGRGRATT